MHKLKYKKLWLSIGYLMIIFVIYSSLTPSPVEMNIEGSDKLMHMIGYFGLLGWFVQIYQQKKVQLILAAVFICMGVALEFLQELGGVRYFELSDMLANTTGVLIAWLLVFTPFPKLLLWFENAVINALATNK